MKYSVLSDIHGRGRRFRNVLKRNVKNRLVLLGDYLDGNSENRIVIEELLNLREKRPDTIFLLGNHEEYLLGSYDIELVNSESEFRKLYPSTDMAQKDWWYEHNGYETHEELKKDMSLYKEYISFIQTMKTIYIDNDLVFTHAPLISENPLESSYSERISNIDLQYQTGKYKYLNIHGHFHMDGEIFPIVDERHLKVNIAHFPDIRVFNINS